jgi:hypothetical protein
MSNTQLQPAMVSTDNRESKERVHDTASEPMSRKLALDENDAGDEGADLLSEDEFGRGQTYDQIFQGQTSAENVPVITEDEFDPDEGFEHYFGGCLDISAKEDASVWNIKMEQCNTPAGKISGQPSFLTSTSSLTPAKLNHLQSLSYKISFVRPFLRASTYTWPFKPLKQCPKSGSIRTLKELCAHI